MALKHPKDLSDDKIQEEIDSSLREVEYCEKIIALHRERVSMLREEQIERSRF